MAINPNTDFSSGAVLTAAQQNRFPRGIVAFIESTSVDSYSTTETVKLTATTFTAVANRYYRLTYYEPNTQLPSGTSTFMTQRIRLTNAAGTLLAFGQGQSQSATQTTQTSFCQTVVTLSAGSTVIVGTMQSSSGTPALFRSSRAFVLVEDLGPS